MGSDYIRTLKARLDDANYRRLAALQNPKLHRFVAEYIELCNPASVFVATDADEHIEYVRRRTIETGEERPLATEGHTVHFDGYTDEQHHDQGRDKENTRYLVPKGVDLGERLNTIDKEAGVAEVRAYLENAMEGKEMFVRFFCLGPTGSDFSIPCAQLTDSSYVAHSEDLLYRQGYEQFRQIGDSGDFFRFVHSAGELVDGVSAHPDKRRIYIDLEENLVYSANTQYGGNTIGLKKLSLRLAIQKADAEGWLAEHMLVMGINGPGRRVTYFAGAFPSACGKTSTGMLPGETIVGDDIAYLRVRDGVIHAANVEKGIFGIIRDVNSQDDPLIWETLHTPCEMIFSNVLVTPEGVPYWIGKDGPMPEKGVNHSGEWYPGKTDVNGNAITPSHKNARFTVELARLPNCDVGALNDPMGLPIGGIVYGGRDSDTSVPVEQAFNWQHGVVTKGASLESETTAATLGAEGVRKLNLMANLDFVAIPLGRYIRNHLNFAKGLRQVPLLFGVNYFLRGPDGEYLNGKTDKHIWLKWMELRANGDIEAIETPTGLIPCYDDLRQIFAELHDKDYAREDYEQQFATRVPEHLHKIERIQNIYTEQVEDTPDILFEVLHAQHERLEHARERHGDFIEPSSY